MTLRAATPALESSTLTRPLPLAAGEKGVPLSAVDIAWLRMDEPDNLMNIHGVLVLAGDPSREAVERLFRERLMRIPRFRQRIALDGGRLVWTDDAAFDLGRHLVEDRLAEPGGDAELATAIGGHLGRPLDRAHPLWEFRLFRGYQTGTVVFARLHHAIGDGVALMVVLLALTDLTREGPATVEAPRDPGAEILNPFFEMLLRPQMGIEAARALAEQIMPETLRLMLAPVEALRRTNFFLKGAGATAALGRLIGRGSDPATPFKGPLHVEKRVAWTEPISLDEVKSLGKSLGGTVNDVLNSAMAGGLRRYLARLGNPPEDLSFRAAMPVNLRPLEEMAALGNRFGLIFLSLPVGITDPVRRFDEMKRRTASLRRSAEPSVVYALLQLMGTLPEVAHRALVAIFQSKATAVFTNVPGPKRPLYFAGNAMRDMFFWVPQAGRLGLGVSIFSYDGRIRMGVATDVGLVPDPERIVEGFYAELEALQSRA